MSNIIDVFKPPKSRDLEPDEYASCLPCQVMATVGSILTGVYFATGTVFDDPKLSPKQNLEKNPLWWRNFIKLGGVGLVGYGIYRGGEGWIWNLEDQGKKYNLSFVL
ncbi:hypothetical protein WICMUC_002083 [Wickerhamomyces mucosus]|uniref:DUF4536 domain-containing protein n=1 Tax=Wickerhamomyces mucosus TaxID=1378264 RepID=A0A9P8PRJ1_9ASCO|nr:hypothetical protein WICMUC_002083 [Wickerhamomyces mucosus]